MSTACTVWYFRASLSTPAIVCWLLFLTIALAAMVGGVVYIQRLAGDLTAVQATAQGLATGEAASGPPLQMSLFQRLAASLQVVDERLAQHTAFAGQLSTGNMEALAGQLQTTDALGLALQTIRDNLVANRREDEQRLWATEGLSRFVEVLRAGKDLPALCHDVVVNLVRTVHAAQGAIFVADTDAAGQVSLVLQACYAYSRTKHLTQQIAPGEGIIGEAYLEGTTIHLTDVPDSFVRITSGLGEANPRHILLVPLKMNETVVGIIELASFTPFRPYEIVFTEKIGENVAHTVSTFRTAETTRRLLGESQQQAEHMRSQEEELRQNQEELQATQEEISRKYNLLFQQLTELNHGSRFEQLRSINATKKRNIEYYFDIIRNQILTFAEDKMMVEAVQAFRQAFDQIASAVGAEQLAAFRESVHSYYHQEFIPRVNDAGQQADAGNFLPEDAAALGLQQLYIAANPHPTGQKSRLHDAGDGSMYSRVHATYHSVILNYLEKFGYYDIFLIDPVSGNIVYSVFKEVDFGTSLLTGPYSKTNFARVVQQAIASPKRDFVRLIDFESYAPSYYAPASFIACPLYDGVIKAGILVFQMPINKINQILTGDNSWRDDGLGQTGETFIVGEDFKARSIARGLIEHADDYLDSLHKAGYGDAVVRQVQRTGTNILVEQLKLDAVRQSLQGATGTYRGPDTRGADTLFAYAPLKIPDVHWVIVSAMQEAEASERINSLR
ncbi:GAF domain-containing protein [Dawidia soli]|uniref:GAF domain-containing protein n=1 Tax=Dawidia soli TaxID=2782352 RepID=A0AAP2DCT5_9BACT|nr:GAF domain-containing protein [Dawidia soli]MBT1689791.1 GAF domain-containing protein [Dawidia soli]